MAMEVAFNAADASLKNLKVELPDKDKLEMYALYKQATEGDCYTQRPGIFDFAEKKKWDAWNSMKGMKQADCMTRYVKRVNELLVSFVMI